jgi:hypothetical protein
VIPINHTGMTTFYSVVDKDTVQVGALKPENVPYMELQAMLG